ncbi:MAG: flavin reductase [Clostridia bacterium]|nr:flavin reductase [Clostridia bacterium]
MFKEISFREIKENLVQMIADEWMLVTAGTKEKGYNMMTASWGFAGELWGSDSMITVIRPNRYTMEFVNDNDYFTLSFYGDNKAIHKICGSQSGRDINKTEATGLTPVFDGDATYFEEARIVVVLKKQYVQQMEEKCFTDSDPLRWYNNDMHYTVVGKVEKVLIKE